MAAEDERVSGERIRGGRRVAYIAGVIVLGLVALFLILLTLAGIGSSVNPGRDVSRTGAIVLTVFCALLATGFVMWAVHLEHQLRRHHPVAARYQATRAPRRGGAGESYRRPRGGRRLTRGRYGPVVTGVYVLVIHALFVGLLVGTVVVHGEAQRSSRVQHHGIPAAGQVVAAENHWHSTRGGGYYTSDAQVSLAPPVQGRSLVNVISPKRSDVVPGTTVNILIDPHDLSYAEFPGLPVTGTSSWIILLVFAVIAALLAGFIDYAGAMLLIRRRRILSTL